VVEEQQIRRVVAAHHDPSRQALVDELRQHPPGANPLNPVERVLRGAEFDLNPDVDDADLEATARSPGHLDVMRRLGLDSHLMVRLVARERILGAMPLIYSGSGRRHGPSEIDLALSVARRAAIAVDNARLYREAQEAVAESRALYQAALSIGSEIGLA